jgi:20S proteasome alpha/beta subunit
MTIAAGFVASDGLLLFADTQFTGYSKSYADKIIPENFGDSIVVFAFAGDGDYAKTAIADSFEAIAAIRERRTVWNIRKSLRRKISKVIQDYNRNCADPVNRPEFLIAIGTDDGSMAMFSTRETAIPPVDRYECRGSGGSIANPAVRDFFESAQSIPLSDLIPCAVYALSVAKRHDAYSGGVSQFAVLRGMQYYPIVPSHERTIQTGTCLNMTCIAACFFYAWPI